MGFDVDRILTKGEINPDLICPICLGVLDTPMQTIMCKHVFCGLCIKRWLTSSNTCPLDRNPVVTQVVQLERVSPSVQNLLSGLLMECEYASEGCKELLKLTEYAWHVAMLCPYNPTLLRLSSNLPRAHVSHWGAIISQPTIMEQQKVVTAFSEMGWPTHVVLSVMSSCGEDRWPRKISSPRLRLDNRQIIEQFVCRRVPGQQAVVIMGPENEHMPKDFIFHPAIFMIFDHGVM